MKRAVKITLITLGALLILIIAAAVAIPYLFKDQIVAAIKEETNKNINAKVDFSDVSLSLFRHFPNLTVRLHDLTVENIEPFAGIKLADVKSADVTVDIMSVIRNEDLRIRGVNVESPKIKVYVLEDGRANYDIAKPSADTLTIEEPADYSGFKANLDNYSITDGDILYDDESLGVYVAAKGLRHSGSGDFTIDVYDLDTQTEIDSLTVTYGGIPYLKKAHTTLDAIFNIDQTNSKYTLKDNALRVNELMLNADGFVQLLDEDNIDMDLTFSTPQNEFKNLLSMIPNAYIAGYEDVQADGQFDLGGFVRGVYNSELEQYPAFQVNLGVENANVQYPDLPLGITNINTDVNVNSPTSDFDDMVIDVPNFAMRLGNNPFRAVFNLQTPISDPAVKAEVDGVIDLRELAQAFPMEGIQELNGVIAADVRADTRLSYIENEQYERVNMDGTMAITGMNYKGDGYPAIQINEAKTAFTPQNVRIDNFDAKLGKSDVRATGRVDNILAYFSPKKTMRGQLMVRSDYFNADEWMPEETTEDQPALPAAEEPAATDANGEPIEIFDRFDFSLDAAAKEIVYDVYKLENTVVRGNIKPNKLVANQLSTKIGDSDLSASGQINNLFDYLFDNQTLTGDITVRSSLLDLNPFMVSEETTQAETTTVEGTETTATEALDPILIPKNVDIDVTANVDQLIYTDLVLRDVQGTLMVENEAVMIEEATANTLGGDVAMSGSYDTKDPENPAFTFKYDLQRFDFQKSFNAFNTFQALAPIGQFLNGTFNSSLIMEGKLGDAMMPKLNTLSAKGFLETLNAVVQNFKPLQAVGNKLNIDYFKSPITIENTRNWFELEDGKVKVEEFDYQFKDIAMTIGGTHSLTQEIDYTIKAKIPRELLERSNVGAAASAGFNQISQQASRFGLNIEQSEFVNVQFNLTGSISDPKVGLNLLGADGENVAASPAEAAKEAVEQEVEEKVAEGKEQVKETAQQAVDSAKTVLGKQAEAVKDTLAGKAKEAIKDKVGSAIDSAAADKIREELDKFNPFKKKKKSGEGGSEKEEGGNGGG